MLNRIAKYIDYKGISVRAFESSIGASDGMIRRAIKNNTDIQGKWLKNIADIYHDIDLAWLITGDGEMLKSDFSVEDKKNEQHDKKKCHDAQNNSNEKNVTPFEYFITQKNVTPFEENVTPICNPNSEIGEFNQTLSMVPEEPDSDRKVDTKNERFRELLDGGGIKDMLELKDALIGSQKAHIAALEAQLRDYRENITDLRRDLQELKKINKPVDHRSDGTTKDYTSSWDDVRGKKKR